MSSLMTRRAIDARVASLHALALWLPMYLALKGSMQITHLLQTLEQSGDSSYNDDVAYLRSRLATGSLSSDTLEDPDQSLNVLLRISLPLPLIEHFKTTITTGAQVTREALVQWLDEALRHFLTTRVHSTVAHYASSKDFARLRKDSTKAIRSGLYLATKSDCTIHNSTLEDSINHILHKQVVEITNHAVQQVETAKREWTQPSTHESNKECDIHLQQENSCLRHKLRVLGQCLDTEHGGVQGLIEARHHKHNETNDPHHAHSQLNHEKESWRKQSLDLQQEVESLKQEVATLNRLQVHSLSTKRCGQWVCSNCGRDDLLDTLDITKHQRSGYCITARDLKFLYAQIIAGLEETAALEQLHRFDTENHQCTNYDWKLSESPERLLKQKGLVIESSDSIAWVRWYGRLPKLVMLLGQLDKFFKQSKYPPAYPESKKLSNVGVLTLLSP
ncbi:hypothetical protein EK21DRAFT_113325 [Setomelanomma holmii]|uniref:Uncharacterized protein n=1 Tax=Setomelanomma holmii TaxID=210430 RepID=A0A9P4LKP3_9PLEO|nr:hypothetical protein EK21DRAFT_113325 [Setomelanomma holmii]